jgi:hypothetical protein
MYSNFYRLSFVHLKVTVISKFGHYHLQQTLNGNYCTVQIALKPYCYHLITKVSSLKQVTEGNRW